MAAACLAATLRRALLRLAALEPGRVGCGLPNSIPLPPQMSALERSGADPELCRRHNEVRRLKELSGRSWQLGNTSDMGASARKPWQLPRLCAWRYELEQAVHMGGTTKFLEQRGTTKLAARLPASRRRRGPGATEPAGLDDSNGNDDDDDDEMRGGGADAAARHRNRRRPEEGQMEEARGSRRRADAEEVEEEEEEEAYVKLSIGKRKKTPWVRSVLVSGALPTCLPPGLPGIRPHPPGVAKQREQLLGPVMVRMLSGMVAYRPEHLRPDITVLYRPPEPTTGDNSAGAQPGLPSSSVSPTAAEMTSHAGARTAGGDGSPPATAAAAATTPTAEVGLGTFKARASGSTPLLPVSEATMGAFKELLELWPLPPGCGSGVSKARDAVFIAPSSASVAPLKVPPSAPLHDSGVGGEEPPGSSGDGRGTTAAASSSLGGADPATHGGVSGVGAKATKKPGKGGSYKHPCPEGALQFFAWRPRLSLVSPGEMGHSALCHCHQRGGCLSSHCICWR